MSLSTIISNQIKEKGPISFAEFMQQALYHPHYGYYSSGRPKFGPAGDFVTAPELTPLFGSALANQVAAIFKSVERPSILEFGAGTGQLCVDVLTRLEILNALPHQYYILDLSSSLKQRQHDAIQEKLPHLMDRVAWISQWPSEPISGVMLANEVLDAMPVHRFMQTDIELLESFIELDEQNQFKESFLSCSNEQLKKHIEHVFSQNNSSYQSEANLLIPGWIKACYESLNQGVLLIVDYGFPRHEYYHPERNMGTLMCHYQHQSQTNPLAHIGEQDMTAHVDFTHVAEAGFEAGFDVRGYTNQAAFLLGNHILQLLAELPENAEKVKHTQAVKRLLQENEMGELFKVIALSKNFDDRIVGFELSDKRHSL